MTYRCSIHRKNRGIFCPNKYGGANEKCLTTMPPMGTKCEHLSIE